MKNLLALSLILLFGSETFSQSDFRNGYIINNNNDTIFGLLNYKGDRANSRLCTFREDEDSKKQEFSPNDIQAYMFTDGKYYVSKNVMSEGNEKLLFLEYLINGIVDMYYYRDDLGGHYFVDNGDNILHELKNEKKEVFVGGNSYYNESKEYLRTLRSSFSQSPYIFEKVNSVTLTHKSLVEIAHDYHAEVCSDQECIIYEKNLPKVIWRLGPAIGMNVMSVRSSNFYSADRYYMRNSDFDMEIYPSYGLFLNVNLPYLNERLYFQYDVTYSHLTLHTLNLYTYESLNYINDITYVINSMNNSFSMEYIFPRGKVRPVLSFGAYFNYYFKTDFTRALEITNSAGTTIQTDEFDESPITSVVDGISLGVGIMSEIFKMKMLFIDLKYKVGIGLTPGLYENCITLGLGVQL